jgi:hypothetical protein
MVHARRQQPPIRPAPYPLGLIAGAVEFEQLYPDEMMKLGCLTAYWSVADDVLCQLLAVLLGNAAKAEAALYSTV